MLHKILRLICGIITIPIVIALIGLVLSIALILTIALSIPCIALWIAVVFPVTFFYGCFHFAVSNTTSEFKYVWQSFVGMADPTLGFRQAIIPMFRDIYEIVRDMIKDIRTLSDKLRDIRVESDIKDT